MAYNIWYIPIIHYNYTILYIQCCWFYLLVLLQINPNLRPRNSIRLHHSHTLQIHGFSRINLSSCGLEISFKKRVPPFCFGVPIGGCYLCYLLCLEHILKFKMILDPQNHRVARSMPMSQQKNEEMADCNGIKTFSPSNSPWILRSSRSRPCLHQISQRYLLPTLPRQGPRTQTTEPETHRSLVFFFHVLKALQASILELGKTRNVHQTWISHEMLPQVCRLVGPHSLMILRNIQAKLGVHGMAVAVAYRLPHEGHPSIQRWSYSKDNMGTQAQQDPSLQYRCSCGILTQIHASMLLSMQL